MSSNGLKIVVLLGLAGGFSAFGDTCYQAYENGFRNPLGQNHPKLVIDEYQNCLRLKKSEEQREIASQQFRAQAGHGGHRGQADTEEVATEKPIAARPIIPPANRPYEPIALSQPQRASVTPQMRPECVGSRYTFIDQDRSISCSAALNNARVAVKFREDRDLLIVNGTSDLARNTR